MKNSAKKPKNDNWALAPRCYESHPIIELGGGEVLGSSCLYPKEGYDIYVGFDQGMRRLGGGYPWEAPDTSKIEFLFKIVDMGVPKSPEDFKKMIKWLSEQLEIGKNIHMGCIGGHGRTGMVMSALIKYICDVDDATTWVRENYCKKAVESQSQVMYLHKHFGIKKVEASKGYTLSTKSVTKSKSNYKHNEGPEVIGCVESPFSIW